MSSTYGWNIHVRPHVDAKLFLKALLSRAHLPRSSGDEGLLRIPGAEWFELRIGRLLAGGSTWVQRLRIRERAEWLRARFQVLAESEAGSLLFFLALILITFLI